MLNRHMLRLLLRGVVVTPLLWLSVAPARAETPPRALHALVVGPTASETGSDLPALLAPLSRAVATSGGSLTLLVGDAATAVALRTTIRDIAARLATGDLALLHVALPTVVEGERTAILTAGADPGRPFATGFDLAEFARLLAQSRGEAVVVLDAPHGSGAELAAPRPVALIGSGERRPERPALMAQADLRGRSVPVLQPDAATPAGGAAAGSTALTQALAEALEGAADYDRDGTISQAELEAWLSHRVRQASGGRNQPVTIGLMRLPALPVARVARP